MLGVCKKDARRDLVDVQIAKGGTINRILVRHTNELIGIAF